jgi:dTDP-glucose pyrophosphorylase/CBS domain-containing protein
MSLRWEALCVDAGCTVVQVLAAIDRGAASIALMVGPDNVLIGTLTDGDIRRALLGGASLDDAAAPYAQTAAITVSPDAERADVLDLMQARGISQVPILDPQGRVLGLHLLRELVGAVELPNAAVVMAGGRGTRLRPETTTVPKPMIEVAGRPILERIVLHLVGSGIREIWLSVNYLAGAIEGHFGDGAAFGCSIHYLREAPELPLGTGGALALLPSAARERSESLLVMNGDLVTRFAVADLLAGHARRGDAVTVGVTEYAHQVPFGVVSVDGDRITGLDEKPTERWLVNAGIYAIQPDVLERVVTGREYPITELVAACLAAGDRVGVQVLDDPWQDVGRPADLRTARGLGR